MCLISLCLLILTSLKSKSIKCTCMSCVFSWIKRCGWNLRGRYQLLKCCRLCYWHGNQTIHELLNVSGHTYCSYLPLYGDLSQTQCTKVWVLVTTCYIQTIESSSRGHGRLWPITGSEHFFWPLTFRHTQCSAHTSVPGPPRAFSSHLRYTQRQHGNKNCV